MNYLGIDVGGTNLKGAVVTENGEVVREASRPTQASRGADIVADAIGELICELAAQEKLGGVGLGCPGIVDNGRGEIVYSCNLNWVKYPLREKLKQRTGYAPELVNDANAAAIRCVTREVCTLELGRGLLRWGFAALLLGLAMHGSRFLSRSVPMPEVRKER